MRLVERVRAVVVVAVACGAATGCSDDSGGSAGAGASCGTQQACGGDPVGSWEIESTCLDFTDQWMLSPFDPPGCKNAVSNVSVSATGTYDFRADGTLTSVGTFDGSMQFTLTDACLKRK